MPTTDKQSKNHLLLMILDNLRYEMQHNIEVDRSYFYDLFCRKEK